jgi:hypothetical protein
MTAPAWWFWGLVVVVLVGLYLSQTAGRLDRLHVRVDRARESLDGQLVRRSAAAVELATCGALDPATSLLLGEAAARARTSPEAERSQAEDTLTLALAAALPDDDAVAAVREVPGGDDLIDELAAVTRRVELAQSFLDDAVRSCAMVRRMRLVQVLHLAGRAPWPTGMVFDAAQPDGLASVSP